MLRENIHELEQKYDCIIPEKRLKVQAVQMRLWGKLDEICRKYDLRYYFFWGALLGAVRHQGFIPWDDDIDVVMPRKDYDKLCEAAAHDIQYPYFLMSKETVGDGFYPHMRLIDVTTTSATSPKMDFVKNHQGIAIDIVPLDGVPIGRMRRIIKSVRLIFDYELVIHALLPSGDMSLKGKIMKPLGKLYCLNRSGKSRAERTEKIKASTDWDESEYIAEGSHDYLFKREDFAETVYLDFEGRKVPVPVGYEHILTELYGDYMQLPSKLLRKISKSEAMGRIVDPDISYADYASIMKTAKPDGTGEVKKRFQRYCKKFDT